MALPRQRHRAPSVVFAMTGARGTPGGIATANLNNLHALTRLCAERSARLDVLGYLEAATDRPEFLPPWVSFQAFGGNRRAYTSTLLRHALRRPLLVFDHVTLALPVLPLAATGLARTAIFAHGSEAWKRIRRPSRWSFRFARLCLTNSHYTLGKMRERLGHFHGVACPLGLSPDFPLDDASRGSAASEPLVLAGADGVERPVASRMLLLVARMDRREAQKGHRPLMDALPALRTQFPDVQLVFPGPGNDRPALAAYAEERGVADAVFLPGWLPTPTVRRLYADCYAFVMPSEQEGFGLAYLEAMSAGRACVGCRDQGAEDVIVDGETGFLLRDGQDRAELSAVLHRLLEDPDLTARLGARGRQRLLDRFTAAHHQARVYSALAPLLC